MASPPGEIVRTTGDGTTASPMIMWLVDPPSNGSRMRGNEQVARELGRHGYTHIWIRHCDHGTTRVRTRGGRHRLVRTDKHITVFCGRRSDAIATEQGDVFLVERGDGLWRIMEDRERSGGHGRGLEMSPYPSRRRGH